MYGILFPYLGWCFQGLDLLDQVQKQIVILVGSGFSADLQAMSHRRDVSITMGNVPLILRKLEVLTFLNRYIILQLIFLCTVLSFINQAFFLTLQPFGTPSPHDFTRLRSHSI